MSIPFVGPFGSYVDYRQGADTGYNENKSIQPVQNGEELRADDQTYPLNRQEENLRVRFETTRGVLDGHSYVNDMDRSFMACGPGEISWDATTGVFTIGGTTAKVYLLPLLTPGDPTAALGVPPITSTLGTLFIPSQSDPSNGITVTSKLHNYQGGDRLSLTVVTGTGTSVVVNGFDITLTVQIGVSIWNAVATALSSTALVTTAVVGGVGSVNTDLNPASFATRTFLVGNWDAEGHVLTGANVATWFADLERDGSTPNHLTNGDTLCIYYPDLIDGAGGGRRESLRDYGTPPSATDKTVISAGSIFNSRQYPERLPNAVPICKTVSGRLMFVGGRVFDDGAALVPFDGGTDAGSVSYAAGPNWADGTPNPATTVQLQLSKIVSDLAGSAGDAKIGSVNGPTLWADTTELSAGSPPTLGTKFDNLISTLAASTGELKIGAATLATCWADSSSLGGGELATKINNIPGDLGVQAGARRIGATPTGERVGTAVQSQLDELDTLKASLALTNTFASIQTFTSNVVANSDIVLAGNFRHGNVTLILPAAAGRPLNNASGWVFRPTNGTYSSAWISGSVSADNLLIFNIPLIIGDRIQSIDARVLDDATTTVMKLYKDSDDATIQIGSTATSTGASIWQDLPISGLTETLASGTYYSVLIGAGDANQICLGVSITYDHP